MGMYGLGIIFAPAIGPALGGYLVEYVDWRLVFFINVPIGIVGAIAAIIVLPKFPGVDRRPLRRRGLPLHRHRAGHAAAGLVRGRGLGLDQYRVLILITVGVLSLALFVVIELEVDQPLLDLRVFRYWPYTNSLIVMR